MKKSQTKERTNPADYQDFGWQHELWDVVRYFRSIGKDEKKLREFWLDHLRKKSSLAVMVAEKGSKKCKIHGDVPLKKETIDLFFKYLTDSENQYESIKSRLRTEEEALSFCEKLGVQVAKTATRNQEHHQSSKSLVAAVAQISSEIASKFGFNIDIDPQHRCVWFKERDLYVTARNLDGVIPSLVNPFVVWEIKEYWGKTKGGSKMSDAIYECLLVGKELREYEERYGSKIYHVVFVDGKEQWEHRVSDLIRFIDLYNQGIINDLIVGQDVELRWSKVLHHILSSQKNS
ncbi:MAG: hypothetical protein HZB76_00080 [Chlamydiae bacterium]|nr:hypothetical protein [Chlamydiota bacterium]